MIVHENVGFNEIFPGYLGQDSQAAVGSDPISAFYWSIEKAFSVARTALQQAQAGNAAAARTALEDPGAGFASWEAKAWGQLKELNAAGVFNQNDVAVISRAMMTALTSVRKAVESAISSGGTWFQKSDAVITDIYKKMSEDTNALLESKKKEVLGAYKVIVELNRKRGEVLAKLKESMKDNPNLLEALKGAEEAHAKLLDTQKNIEEGFSRLGLSQDELNKQAGLGALISNAAMAGPLVWVLSTLGAAVVFGGWGEGDLPRWMWPQYKITAEILKSERLRRAADRTAQKDAELFASIKNDERRSALEDIFKRSMGSYSDITFASSNTGEAARKIGSAAALAKGRADAGEKAAWKAYLEGRSAADIEAAGDAAFKSYAMTSVVPYIIGFGLAGVMAALAIYHYTHRK